MNWKIKNVIYNKEMGFSAVTISTRLGIYTGTSQVHPDDEDIASEFEGCHYAEGRAAINYLKEEKRIATIKLATLKNVYQSYEQMKYFSENKKEIKVLKAKIKDCEDKLNEITKGIEGIKKHIEYSISHYREDKKHFEELVSKNKEKKKLVPED
jgi:hypothetical protein